MPPERENKKPIKRTRTKKARAVPVRIVKNPKKPRKLKAVNEKKVNPKPSNLVARNPALETSLDLPAPAFSVAVTQEKKQTRGVGRYLLLLLLNASIIMIVGIVFWSFYSRPVERVAAISMPTIDRQVITGEVSSSSPRTLSIPSVGINARVTPVGLTKEGNMGVPASFDDVGWFKYGPLPGQSGNAVMDGHLDNGKGKPGVFYNLDKVRMGDFVYVDNDNGETVQFRVTRVQLIDYNTTITSEIFGETDGQHLNLITCDGMWIPEQKTYSERLVVFTERVIN
jgi:LPXTG-site transpeptidase (sortase) family protein